MRPILSLGFILGFGAEAQSQGFAPDEVASRVAPAAGLSVSLYAAEPDVRQSIVVKFEGRGRLWTVQ